MCLAETKTIIAIISILKISFVDAKLVIYVKA